MVKVNAAELPILAEAVRVWTGYGKSAAPHRDDSSVAYHFDPKTASELLPAVKSLEKEFYLSDAWKTAADLAEMGEIASEHFKCKHPEIPDEIVRAFAWCYTYDYK